MAHAGPQHPGGAQEYYDGNGYGQPNPPPPPSGPPLPPSESNYYPPQGPPPAYTFEDQFAVRKPKYHDVWASLLFLATLLGYSAVSGLALFGYSDTRSTQGAGIYDDENDFGLSTNTIVLFMFVLAVALVFSMFVLWGARMFTKQFIYAAGIINVVVGIGTAIFYFVEHYWSAAIVFLVFSLFYMVCFWSWRKRIPFAVVILETVIDVAQTRGHVWLVSFLGGLMAMAFGAWFAITFVGVYSKYTPSPNNPACDVGGGGCSHAKVIGLLVFITFAGYWITEIIKNVIHVTVSGIYGSWYYYAYTSYGMPHGSTRGAFRRSMTYSFGSISFGSLLASIVQVLRQAASIAKQERANDGDPVACLLYCLLSCLLNFLDWLIQYFNHYCFSYIALYGTSYIQGAKETWRLMKHQGVDALINDSLIDPVLTMGAVFVGYVCALLAFLYLKFTSPAYNANGDYTVVIMAFSFLIGLQVANIFMVALKSGTATLFTCIAHSPEILARDREHNQIYERLHQEYPQTLAKIHG